jgi:protein O-GlcNAc transferase
MLGWLKRRGGSVPDPRDPGIEAAIIAARAAIARGDLPAAEALVAPVLKTRSPPVDAFHLAGVLASLARDFVRASHFLETAVRLVPDRADAWFSLGELRLETGDLPGALDAVRTTLEADPNFVPAHARLVQLLAANGLHENAIEAYQIHRLLDWHFDVSWNPVAALHAQGRLDEAEAVLEAEIARRSADAVAHLFLGCTRQARGRLDDAIDCYRQALAHDPTQAFTHRKLAFALDSRGAVEAALPHYREARTMEPWNLQAWSDAFAAGLYVTDPDPAQRVREFEAFDQRFRTARPLASGFDRPPGRPLRVGYVSGDFCEHVIGFFFEPLLASHDRSRVEVWCYDRTRQRDPASLRLEALTDHWRRVVGMDWDAMAELVASDGIDILVDLKGHFDDNNLPLFARRPAPVQVTWLGYPGTTGLRTIDAWITDKHIASDLSAQYASERIVALPRFFMAFRPLGEAPSPGPLPALANGWITLGCFNAFPKVSMRMRETMARLMLAMPTARCIVTAMPAGRARADFLAWFEEKGIAPARFELRGRGAHEAFLQWHREVDITLDSFPYNGTTTTLHSLWMGVPVVTLAGATHVSRVGGSVLENLGMSEWIAASTDDYVAITCRHASDVAALAALRSSLRARLAASAIMDARGFARDLEDCYEALVRDRCGSISGVSSGRPDGSPVPS